MTTKQHLLPKPIVEMPPPGFKCAYDAGFDAAVNGANTTNCSLKWFTSRQSTAEWQQGNDDGLKSDRTKR